mmetsp:Transcript_40090/g.94222  ORF Transcript_40090/g.94222 Transcript_40090/m.94222 type:complete len:257 (+) Transcript_40090:2470-3240(+)
MLQHRTQTPARNRPTDGQVFVFLGDRKRQQDGLGDRARVQRVDCRRDPDLPGRSQHSCLRPPPPLLPPSLGLRIHNRACGPCLVPRAQRHCPPRVPGLQGPGRAPRPWLSPRLPMVVLRSRRRPRSIGSVLAAGRGRETTGSACGPARHHTPRLLPLQFCEGARRRRGTLRLGQPLEVFRRVRRRSTQPAPRRHDRRLHALCSSARRTRRGATPVQHTHTPKRTHKPTHRQRGSRQHRASQQVGAVEKRATRGGGR